MPFLFSKIVLPAQKKQWCMNVSIGEYAICRSSNKVDLYVQNTGSVLSLHLQTNTITIISKGRISTIICYRGKVNPRHWESRENGMSKAAYVSVAHHDCYRNEQRVLRFVGLQSQDFCSIIFLNVEQGWY
jgi:hypothetical protein